MKSLPLEGYEHHLQSPPVPTECHVLQGDRRVVILSVAEDLLYLASSGTLLGWIADDNPGLLQDAAVYVRVTGRDGGELFWGFRDGSLAYSLRPAELVAFERLRVSEEVRAQARAALEDRIARLVEMQAGKGTAETAGVIQRHLQQQRALLDRLLGMDGRSL